MIAELAMVYGALAGYTGNAATACGVRATTTAGRDVESSGNL
jgi:hypothetical protein